MSALLQAELLKLRTTRTFVALAGSALGLTLLIAGLVAGLTDDLAPEDQRTLLQLNFTSVFVLVLGVIGMAGEWRHKTIAGSLLAAPDRILFVLAKIAAYAIAGVVLTLVVGVLSAALIALLVAAQGGDVLPLGDVIEVLAAAVLIAAFMGAIGVGIGALVRNQAGAIVIVLVVLFVVEPTVSAFYPEVGKFLPLVGAPSAFDGDGAGDEDLDEVLSGPVAVLVELGWVAGLGAAAALLLRRRDVV